MISFVNEQSRRSRPGPVKARVRKVRAPQGEDAG